MQILQEKGNDAINMQVPFTRLSFDVALRCMMGVRLPVQHGGYETDSLMNTGRDSVGQLGTSWMVFLSKWEDCS